MCVCVCVPSSQQQLLTAVWNCTLLHLLSSVSLLLMWWLSLIRRWISVFLSHSSQQREAAHSASALWLCAGERRWTELPGGRHDQPHQPGGWELVWGCRSRQGRLLPHQLRWSRRTHLLGVGAGLSRVRDHACDRLLCLIVTTVLPWAAVKRGETSSSQYYWSVDAAPLWRNQSACGFEFTTCFRAGTFLKEACFWAYHLNWALFVVDIFCDFSLWGYNDWRSAHTEACGAGAGWRGGAAPAGACFTGDSGPPPPTSVHSPLCGTWWWTAVAQHGSVANPPAGAQSIPWSFSVSGGGGWWGGDVLLDSWTEDWGMPPTHSQVRSPFPGIPRRWHHAAAEPFFPCRIACLVCS